MNSPEFRKEVGNKIKRAREKAKLTQVEVSEKAGISTNYYACVERGEVNIAAERLQKIGEVLGIKLLNI